MSGVKALCEMLKVNTTLQNINLSNNRIGIKEDNGNYVAAPKRPIAIAEALKVNKTLTSINLSDNILTNHGWDMSGIIQIAEALKVNTTLQSIDLRDNGLDDKAKRLLRQAAPHVTFTF